jgi:hypothetical protein
MRVGGKDPDFNLPVFMTLFWIVDRNLLESTEPLKLEVRDGTRLPLTKEKRRAV